jgi:hypothetical protein
MVSACNNDPGTDILTPEWAQYYFRAVSDICAADAGRMWGINLCGPIMYVDQNTRKIYASEPDREGLLKPKDGVFTGSYPKEKIIDVIAVEYGGTLFAMVPVFAPEDEYRLKAYTFHALTHCMQKKKGISPRSFNNRHLNDRNARMWLKLEWKALRQAISSEGEERELAIRDALIFRGARHESFPAYVDDETRFENYEGLATFTYTRLVTSSVEEQKRRLLDGLRRYYDYRSFGQNYGFIHGALYAYLLADKGLSLEIIDADNVDLGRITAEVYNISTPEVIRDVAGSIAINYDIQAIREEENERERRIKEAVNKELSIFTEKPVIYFKLESPSFGFEPEDPNTLDTLGTIYKSIRVSDNWGKLVVEETGCLVSHNLNEIRVPARGVKISKNHVSGEEWTLLLNDSWEIVKTGQDYLVKRVGP